MRKTRRSRPRLASQGFNLVILVMAVTVLNILLALALPAWSTMIQREKEQELIFRGLQYAEAVRVFQIRQGRLPTRIAELIEVQPRSIRQLWKNPMAEDGAWLLLPAQGQVQPGGQQVERADQQDPQGRARPGSTDQLDGGDPSGRQRRQPQLQAVRVVPPRPGEPVLTPGPSVPFAGVASPEGESSLKTFMGSNEIKEWRFTVDVVSAMQPSADLSFARPVHSGMFWRPFPPGVTPPNQGQSPNPLANRPGQLAPNAAIEEQIRRQQQLRPRNPLPRPQGSQDN